MCPDIQNINVLNYQNPRIRNNECIICGQCITVCPIDALKYKNSKSSVFRALANKKILVLQIAPAAPGAIVTGKIIQAARQLGFKYVFDTNFGADITVIEEANEPLRRMKIDVDSSFNENNNDDDEDSKIFLLKTLNPIMKSTAVFNLNNPKRQISLKSSLPHVTPQRRGSITTSNNLIMIPNRPGSLTRHSYLTGPFSDHKQFHHNHFSEGFNRLKIINCLNSLHVVLHWLITLKNFIMN